MTLFNFFNFFKGNKKKKYEKINEEYLGDVVDDTDEYEEVEIPLNKVKNTDDFSGMEVFEHGTDTKLDSKSNRKKSVQEQQKKRGLFSKKEEPKKGKEVFEIDEDDDYTYDNDDDFGVVGSDIDDVEIKTKNEPTVKQDRYDRNNNVVEIEEDDIYEVEEDLEYEIEDEEEIEIRKPTLPKDFEAESREKAKAKDKNFDLSEVAVVQQEESIIIQHKQGLLGTKSKDKKDYYSSLKKQITDDDLAKINNALIQGSDVQQVLKILDEQNFNLSYLVALSFADEEDITMYRLSEERKLKQQQELGSESEIEEDDYLAEIMRNAKKPPVVQPIVEEPSYTPPIAQEPTYVEPISELPSVEEPTYVEPISEIPNVEPISELPSVEEPSYVEPISELPKFEPISETPIMEVPKVEEPIEETNLETTDKPYEDKLGTDKEFVPSDEKVDVDKLKNLLDLAKQKKAETMIKKKEELEKAKEEHSDVGLVVDTRNDDDQLTTILDEFQQFKEKKAPKPRTVKGNKSLDVGTIKRNVYIIYDGLTEFPENKKYNLVALNSNLKLTEYLGSKENLMVISNRIPIELQDKLIAWLDAISVDKDNYRMVTIKSNPVKHPKVEKVLDSLNNLELDKYFEEHPIDKYLETNNKGSFIDLSELL